MSELVRSQEGVALLELPHGFQVIWDGPNGCLVWGYLAAPAPHSEVQLAAACQLYETTARFLQRAFKQQYPKLSRAQWNALYAVVKDLPMTKNQGRSLGILLEHGLIYPKPGWAPGKFAGASRFVPNFAGKTA